MWLDGRAEGEAPREGPEWPDWYVIRPYEIKGSPYLIAVYSDGTEVGPYPVALPQP